MSLVEDPKSDAQKRRCAAASIRRAGQVFGIIPGAAQRSTPKDTVPARPAPPPRTESGLPARWRLPEEERGTCLYLAYGSNLCYETFQGRRGVKPLAYVNVVVPSLRLTFDLPGLPYIEPCFANTARRDPSQTPPGKTADETSSLLHTSDYHKDRWKKGLVGVVYECSKEDYARIIATEGGGSSYQDILVDCFVIHSDEEIPMNPKSEPFKAHTLFAPLADPSIDREAQMAAKEGGRTHRPDPSYAQPSARYLKFFIDGADEHDFPEEYKEYLRGLRPFTISTTRQRIGQIFIIATWGPLLGFLLALAALFQDKNGRNPRWLTKLQELLFFALWTVYDKVYKPIYGDGERTIGNK